MDFRYGNPSLHCMRMLSDNNIFDVEVINFEYCTRLSDQHLRVLLRNPCTTVQSINLSFTNITDLGIHLLAKQCPNLTSINLKCCAHVSSKGLSAIAQYCARIERLNVAECQQVSDLGIQLIAQQSKTNLKSIDLSHCKLITDSIFHYLCFHCPNLDTLKLQGTSVTSQGIDAALAMLALVELNVNGTDISRSTLQLLGKHSGDKLKCLDIGFCYKVEGLDVRELLGTCRNLTELLMFGCLENEEELRALKEEYGKACCIVW
uniref:F-box/LRR-repeat protein 15-like leucin rich repeat domain-containing protein n=1 Tax=Arcella intermedia TaxID=1963864 RepID=A0A6B2LBN3_9EUKA